jgi:hypothetical protein
MRRQARFLRAVLTVLVDLTVLNLYVEYRGRVVIDSFTVSLLTALVISAGVVVTLTLERRIAGHYAGRSGTRPGPDGSSPPSACSSGRSS